MFFFQENTIHYSLDHVDVSVSVLPVEEQVCLLVVVHSDVLVVEHAREKIINLHRHIQDVTNSVIENILISQKKKKFRSTHKINLNYLINFENI